MRFRLFAPAFIDLPTTVVDGEHSYTKSTATRINHDDGRTITNADPKDVDFPASLPIDSVSRTWLALDDEAKKLQAKLSKPVRADDAPAITDAASALDALKGLPEADRAKIAAALAPKAK